jgi:hypothetical protein
MRKIVIGIVADKDSPQFGKLAVHAEEDRMESETWSPNPVKMLELLEPLLKELTARSEEFKDPLVVRTIADLKTVQQEIMNLL